MRLKTLELKGFKSFANETVLHFNDDVTGVVGPNGSGKSNVVDAVRWVLGEQKTGQLRLDKMASVIFNGTKKRKEAQMAQVSLTFENTRNILPVDYQTVTISRILYRSGESEYRKTIGSPAGARETKINAPASRNPATIPSRIYKTFFMRRFYSNFMTSKFSSVFRNNTATSNRFLMRLKYFGIWSSDTV